MLEGKQGKNKMRERHGRVVSRRRKGHNITEAKETKIKENSE